MRPRARPVLSQRPRISRCRNGGPSYGPCAKTLRKSCIPPARARAPRPLSHAAQRRQGAGVAHAARCDSGDGDGDGRAVRNPPQARAGSARTLVSRAPAPGLRRPPRPCVKPARPFLPRRRPQSPARDRPERVPPGGGRPMGQPGRPERVPPSASPRPPSSPTPRLVVWMPESAPRSGARHAGPVQRGSQGRRAARSLPPSPTRPPTGWPALRSGGSGGPAC